MKQIICVLLVCVMLIGIAAAESQLDNSRKYTLASNGEAIISDVPFFGDGEATDNNRVFYEIFVGSFSDSNGDGIGDLRGIINRMDYLNDGDPQSGLSLGIEGIWLTPIFSSPSYHKYDVTDFYTIDPAFGTMDDLEELVALCHERNVKLILDLPINHTSTQCRWFKSFINAHLMQNTLSDYYDFYVWLPKDGQTEPGLHYAKLESAKILYEANFADSMPELNFDNPLVRQETLDIALFYLDLGVDGFRFDAAKYIYLGNNEQSIDFWSWYIGELKQRKPDLYTVAEVWDGAGIIDRYITSVNCFNFTTSQVNGLIAETAKAGNVNQFTSYIQQYMDKLHTIRPEAMNILFVSNHDMDRAAGFLSSSNGRMQMAANLYLLSPGSPFIYYGEEIGLRGSRGGANTDANRRLAMLWGDGDTVKDPIGTTYDPSNQTPYSVKDLYSMGTGLYNYYKRLIMIRKANPEIARGEYKALAFTDTKVGGFLCTLDGSTVAVLHNTTNRDISVDLSQVTDIAFDYIAAAIGIGSAQLDGTVLLLESQTSAVLRRTGE